MAPVTNRVAADQVSKARAASAAATNDGALAAVDQQVLSLQTNTVKMMSAALPGLRQALKAALDANPQVPANITAARDAIAKLETALSQAQSQLSTLQAKAQASTDKANGSSGAAIKANKAVADTGEAFEKDAFDAKAKADGFGVVSKSVKAGDQVLKNEIKRLTAQLGDKALTAGDRAQIKASIATLKKMEAAMSGTAKTLDASAGTATKEASAAEAKAKAFAPNATVANAKMRDEAMAAVKRSVAGFISQGGSAAAAASTKVGPAGLALVDAALAGPNADRAMAAWTKLDDLAAKHPATAARLTPEIRQMLVLGVADPRVANDAQSLEGVMGSKQVEAAATALLTMPDGQYKLIDSQLKAAATGPKVAADASAVTEQALILKAVAARAKALTGTDPVQQTVATSQLIGFAADIRGESRSKLVRSTSAIDIASSNDSPVAPYDLGNRAGVEASPLGSKNDGHFQRFADTCAPTDAQIALGEADPVAARQMSKDASNADPRITAAKEQKQVLEANGGSTVSERAFQPYNAAIAKAKQLGFSGVELTLLERELKGGNEDGTVLDTMMKFHAAPLLGKLRAADAGHPTAQEVGWMQTELDGGHAGMTLDPALNQIAKPATDITYQYKTTTPAGVTNAELAQWDVRLKQNQDVPIRVDGGGGHFMIVTDVRGQSPNQRYQIADPGSGITDWVSAADIQNPASNWPSKQYGNGKTFVTGYYTE